MTVICFHLSINYDKFHFSFFTTCFFSPHTTTFFHFFAPRTQSIFNLIHSILIYSSIAIPQFIASTTTTKELVSNLILTKSIFKTNQAFYHFHSHPKNNIHLYIKFLLHPVLNYSHQPHLYKNLHCN